jgi:hypothetical protein
VSNYTRPRNAYAYLQVLAKANRDRLKQMISDVQEGKDSQLYHAAMRWVPRHAMRWLRLRLLLLLPLILPQV